MQRDFGALDISSSSGLERRRDLFTEEGQELEHALEENAAASLGNVSARIFTSESSGQKEMLTNKGHKVGDFEKAMKRSASS